MRLALKLEIGWNTWVGSSFGGGSAQRDSSVVGEETTLGEQGSMVKGRRVFWIVTN